MVVLSILLITLGGHWRRQIRTRERRRRIHDQWWSKQVIQIFPVNILAATIASFGVIIIVVDYALVVLETVAVVRQIRRNGRTIKLWKCFMSKLNIWKVIVGDEFLNWSKTIMKTCSLIRINCVFFFSEIDRRRKRNVGMIFSGIVAVIPSFKTLPLMARAWLFKCSANNPTFFLQNHNMRWSISISLSNIFSYFVTLSFGFKRVWFMISKRKIFL